LLSIFDHRLGPLHKLAHGELSPSDKLVLDGGMALDAAVLSPLTLPALLNYILCPPSSASPTTLLLCSTRESFLLALSRALQKQDGPDAEGFERLIAPALHNLLTARHVNVVFCASVQTLLAQLTAYGGSGAARKTRTGLDGLEEKETLVLVNPLALHAPTPSFSAQGLSRTFAAAVDNAVRVGAKLRVVECLGMQEHSGYHEEEEEADVAMRDGEESNPEVEADPWEQEVPILNLSARRFGSGSRERSWAGRTVKVNRVAGRWFRFQRLKAEGG
jgi:hypothetical protein